MITEIPLHESFEVMGHTFRNLKEVRNAVSIVGRSSINWKGERYIWQKQPSNPVPGLYICLIYEPYPRFDESDYDYENRNYWNYFFSDKPFSIEDVNQLSELPAKINYRYIHEDIPKWATPALYWGGDSADNLLLATI